LVVVATASGADPGPPPAWLDCSTQTAAELASLEYSLRPSDGATVVAGTTVTFSGDAAHPVTFVLASSPDRVSTPDIDGGPGTPQPGMSSPGSSTYAFTSTKAAAIPRTIYWAASFTSGSSGCAGSTQTTKTRTLTIQPPPPPVQPTADPVRVSISVVHGSRTKDPTIAYSIHCSTSCSGDGYVLASVTRHRAGVARVFGLDFGPTRVSVSATGGGDAQITHRYRGRTLRLLRRMIAKNGAVQLQFNVKVTDAYGSVARAHSTAQISG
jgi:hypothetical protein